MSSFTHGSTVPDPEVNLLKRLLGTIEPADHQAFLAPGTTRSQKGISPAMFDRISVRWYLLRGQGAIAPNLLRNYWKIE